MATLHPTSIEARRLIAESLEPKTEELKIRRYEFTVTMAGYGETQEAAWQDACAEFALEPGEPHDDVVITDEPNIETQDLGEDISAEDWPARAAEMVKNIDAAYPYMIDRKDMHGDWHNVGRAANEADAVAMAANAEMNFSDNIVTVVNESEPATNQPLNLDGPVDENCPTCVMFWEKEQAEREAEDNARAESED